MVGVSEAEIRAALDAVLDPCSVVAGAPAGLVQMGLVRALELSEGESGATIRVRIGVTEPGCLMGASFAAQARTQLERLDGVAHVEIELDHASDWMPDDMDRDYQRRLDAVRATRRAALERQRTEIARARDLNPHPPPTVQAS
jgi:metal-sulfur cluster biosynthetic enzyme